MPRNNAGTYSLPSGTTATTGTTISSTAYNAFVNDVASELTASLPRSGSASMGGALAMAGNKITGLAAGTTTGDAATFDQIGSAFFQSGTVMLFQNATAPVGWTKQTVHNDKALRVVSGTPSTGGNKNFSTVFTSTTVTNAHTLVASEMPSHTHTATSVVTDPGHTHTYANAGGTTSRDSSGSTQVADASSGTTGSRTTGITVATTTASAGSDGGHSHVMPLDVLYVDVVFAVKN